MHKLAAKLIVSEQYKEDRLKIMDSILFWALENDEDAELYLRYFRNDEKRLHKLISDRPLLAGINLPHPTKKAVTTSGKYAVFYSTQPLNAKANTSVDTIIFHQIISTRTKQYNKTIKLIDF